MLTIAKIIKKKSVRGITTSYETPVLMPISSMDNAVDVNRKNKQGSEDENKRKRMLGKNEISIELLCKHMGHMVQT